MILKYVIKLVRNYRYIIKLVRNSIIKPFSLVLGA